MVSDFKYNYLSMDYSIEKYHNLTLLSVTNNIGMEVTLSNLGAAFYSIKIDGVHMLSAPENLDDFALQNVYHGKTIGAIANRVKLGNVFINNIQYKLDLNEGPNTLHNGKDGLSNKVFSYSMTNVKEGLMITFNYKKQHLEDGLPGNINYLVSYLIYDNKNIVELELTAITDMDTVISLTNHAFFSLGDDSIKNLSLTIPSEYYIRPNPDDLIAEEVLPVDECLSFEKKKLIVKDIKNPSIYKGRTKGYDHCYLLSEGDIILENKKYKLNIETNFSCVQIYTDNYEDDYKYYNSNKKVNRSIAIEPEDNLLNRKVTTTKNPTYQRKIKYTFITKQ